MPKSNEEIKTQIYINLNVLLLVSLFLSGGKF